MKKLLLAISLLPLALSAQTPTWSVDIAPIFYDKCTSCHHNGGAGPFSLMEYADVGGWEPSIEHAVLDRHMPPWPPDPNYRHFAGERVLTQAEISTITTWIANGTPQGDPNLAPTPPVYVNGPRLNNPDLTVTMPTYVSGAVNEDVYRCFVLPSNTNIDRFISAMEVVPGNSAIVHHVLVFQDTSNRPNLLDAADPGPGYTSFGGVGSNSATLIGGWAPGAAITRLPNGTGIKLLANAKIVLQVHYPTGSDGQADSTTVRFKYSTFPSPRQVFMAPILNHQTSLVNGPLFIPANTVRTFEERFTMPLSATFLNIAPHMHLIGQNMLVYGVGLNNDTIPLINIPHWDFHWQGGYSFQFAQPIPAGTVLHAFATFDNTPNNLNNPVFPPQDVQVGEATNDEMMLNYFAFMGYQPGDENILQDSAMIVGVEPLGPDRAGSLTCFPNPAAGEVNISFDMTTGEQVTLECWNMDGKMVFNKPIAGNAGNNLVPISTSNLTNGVYYFVLQTKNKRWLQRVAIVH